MLTPAIATTTKKSASGAKMKPEGGEMVARFFHRLPTANMKSPTGQACKKQHVALAEDELLGRHDVLALERVERDPDDERCVRASERYRASCTHKHETVRERKNPTPAPHIAFARTEREREPRVVLVLVVDQQVVDVPSVESHIFTPAAHCVRPCLHWAGGGKNSTRGTCA